MNWPLLICLGVVGYALLIAFMARAFWHSSQADNRDEQLIAEIQAMRGDPCPWPIKED